MHNWLPPESLFFAPMEGITDEAYRLTISRCFPSWDYLATDFLRIPSEGSFSTKRVLKHFGPEVYHSERLKSKTFFQVLASTRSNIQCSIDCINQLDISWLDLNLGCPSKKVNSHQGGAYLLSNLHQLEKIIRLIRSHFKRRFTCKIRVGYHNDDSFQDIIKLLENEGVEAITIHARTRDQMYKGVANWDYIKKAVELSSLPIIGNGDLWTLSDIEKMFQYTGCRAVMLARGALKTPWIAELYRKHRNDIQVIDKHKNFLLHQRKKFLRLYFEQLECTYKEYLLEDAAILSRFKALSRYIFDDFERPSGSLKSLFLRTQSLNEFKQLFNNAELSSANKG